MNPHGPRTVASAFAYWDGYYNAAFVPGLGTEHVLAMLATVPPVTRWLDVGAGSESLLWAIALRFEHLMALDIDADRLALLRTLAETAQPRAAYRTVLDLCGRSQADFAARCARLGRTLVTDCLSAPLPPRVLAAPCDLITQFGLLGLSRNSSEFSAAVRRIHTPLTSGGWCAGANWARHAPEDGRVPLSAELFHKAFAEASLTLTHLEPVPSLDPRFPTVWCYLGRRPPCPSPHPATISPSLPSASPTSPTTTPT